MASVSAPSEAIRSTSMTLESGTDDAPRSDPDELLEPPEAILDRLGVSGWDATALVAAALAIVLFAPPLFLDSWTPRMALVLGVAPVGLVALGRAVRSGDRSSQILLAAMIWTVVISVLSPAPRSALFGFAGRDLSALTICAVAGFWTLGRLTSARGRELLSEVVIWSATLSGAVGIAQVLADVDTGALALAFGRPTGLASNPVYYGAISAAGLMVCVASWRGGAWRRLLVPIVVLGAATSLSGSRVALLAAVVGIGVHTAARRDRDSVLAGGLGLASVASGVLVDRTAGAGRNAADRLTEGSGGGGRTAVWRYGLEAFADRPVLGHGFGRFRPAIQDKFTAEFVRDNSIDDVTQAWFDAHNIGIGVLVAVGVVGAVLFVAWAGSWVRFVRGPLAWALVPLAFHWLLQPVSLFTLPLAMLLFGAAGSNGPALAPPGRRSAAVATAIGVVLATVLVVGDVAFRRAADDLDADTMATIAAAVGDDPVLGDVVAQAYELQADSVGADSDELDWRRRVASSEPDRPFWWSRLAEEQLEADLVAEAEASIERAVVLQRNNVRTVRVEVLLALRAEDEERLGEALALACALGASDCGIVASELIDEYRASRTVGGG